MNFQNTFGLKALTCKNYWVWLKTDVCAWKGSKKSVEEGGGAAMQLFERGVCELGGGGGGAKNRY